MYSDRYCVVLQLLHNCLRSLGNIIRFASFSAQVSFVLSLLLRLNNSILSLERNCALNVVSVFRKTRKKIMSLWNTVVILLPEWWSNWWSRMMKEWWLTQHKFDWPRMFMFPNQFVASTKWLSHGKILKR